eukprot:scaffold23822_cov31-Tisochrysis_lutea.AAC.2
MQWEPLHHHDRDPHLEPLPQEDSHWLHHLDALLCADGVSSQLIEADRAEELEQSRGLGYTNHGHAPSASSGTRMPVPPSRPSTYSSIKSAFPEPHKINRLDLIGRAIDLEDRCSPASPPMEVTTLRKSPSADQTTSGLQDKLATCRVSKHELMKVAAHLNADAKMSKGRKRMATSANQAPDAKSARIRRCQILTSNGNTCGSAEAEAAFTSSQEGFPRSCATFEYYADCCPAPMPASIVPFTSAIDDATRRSSSLSLPSPHADLKPMLVRATQTPTMTVPKVVGTSSSSGDVRQMARREALVGSDAESLDGDDSFLKARDAWEQLIASLPVKTSGRKAWLPEPDLFFNAVDQGIFRDTGRQLEQEYVLCRAEQAAGGGRELCKNFVSKLRQVGISYLAHLASPPTPTATSVVRAVQLQHAKLRTKDDVAACAASAPPSMAPMFALEEPSDSGSSAAPSNLDTDETFEDFTAPPVSYFTWTDLEEAIFDELSASH